MNGNFIRAKKQRYSNEEIPTPTPSPLLLGISFSIFYQPPTTPTPQLLILKFFPTPCLLETRDYLLLLLKLPLKR